MTRRDKTRCFPEVEKKKENYFRASLAMCLGETLYRLIPYTTFEKVYRMLAPKTRPLVLLN